MRIACGAARARRHRDFGDDRRERARREAGFEPWMSAASAQTQDWVAALARSGLLSDLGAESGWRDYADRIIAAPENSGAAARKRTGGRS